MMATPSNRVDIAPADREDVDFRLLIDLCPDALIVTTQSIVVFANPAAQAKFGTPDTPDLIGYPFQASVEATERPGLYARDIVFRGCPSRLLVFRDTAEPVLAQIAARVRHDLSQPLNVIRLAAEGALLMIERGKTPVSGWPENQFALIAEQAERTAQCLEDIDALFRPKLTRPAVQPSRAIDPPETHLLIVGDESIAATIRDHVHNTAETRVSDATTCNEAWNRFRSDPADVVMIDRDGTIGDDTALIARLRDFDPLQPIIVISSQPNGLNCINETYRDERLAAVKKPLDWPTFDRLITAFLRPPAEAPITPC